LVADELEQPIPRTGLRGRLHSQRRRGARRHECGIREGCELDHPYAVGVRLEQAARQLERQTRLPTSTGAGDRDHPMLAHEPGDFLEVVFAPDEAGETPWKIPRDRSRLWRG